EILIDRIMNACDTIRNNPGIFQRVHQSMHRRCNVLRCVAGHHFEHLL
ncbi:hypothetical protein EAG_08941, partial [Camponotus floridanus]